MATIAGTWPARVFQRRWPNPKDSTGEFYGRIGKFSSCWEAIDPARSVFKLMDPEIKIHLQKFCPPVRETVTWCMYMIGKTRERSEPFIMFCCSVKECRKLVRREIEKESDILEKYPGVRVGDCGRAPEFERLIQLGPSVISGSRGMSKSGISLLCVEPGEPASNISCRFVTMPIHGDPTYTIIHFKERSLWSSTADITINDTVYKFPNDLVETIRHCRSQDTPTYIRVAVHEVQLPQDGDTYSISLFKNDLYAIPEILIRGWSLDDQMKRIYVVYKSTRQAQDKLLLSMEYQHEAHSHPQPRLVRATAGAILKSGTRYFYLTAAHPFFNETRYIGSQAAEEAREDDECDIGEESIADTEELSELLESTSRGSRTPEPVDNSNSDATSSSPEVLSNPIFKLHESSTHDVVVKDTIAKSNHPRVEIVSSMDHFEDKNKSLEPIGYVDEWYSKDMSPYSSSLDYVLIDIKAPDSQTFNKAVVSATTKTTILYPQNIATYPQNKTVFAITALSGTLKGTLSGTPTFSMIANSKEMQEMWIVRLEGKVELGDSGSLVIDAENGDAIGHMVAGSPETGVIYIVPLYQVIKDIRLRRSMKIGLATRANSAPAFPRNTVSSYTQTEALKINPEEQLLLHSKGKSRAVGKETLPPAVFQIISAKANVKTRNQLAGRDEPLGSGSMNPFFYRTTFGSQHTATSDNMSQSSTYVGSGTAEFTQHSNGSRVTVVDDDPALLSYRKENSAPTTKVGIWKRNLTRRIKKKLGLGRKRGRIDRIPSEDSRVLFTEAHDAHEVCHGISNRSVLG
jgi:hypothetical protein